MAVAFIGGIYYCPNHREIVNGLASFALAIRPVIKLVHFGIFIAADRLIYFPSIGLVFLLGWVLHRLFGQRLRVNRFTKAALFIVVDGIFGILAGVNQGSGQGLA
jgi:hypothetical protein